VVARRSPSPSARRSARAAVAVAVAVVVIVGAGTAPGALAAGQIVLPVTAPNAGRPVNPTDLLGADRPGEIPSHAPGAVDDTEVVRAGLAPTGALATVAVDQTLVVHGVGDFELNVPGPAIDVDAPPAQSPQPGLRRAAVVWQGFSPGRKRLDATVTLDPSIEALRLPLRVSITDGGTRIANATGVPTTLTGGVAAPAELEAALAAAGAALAGGRAPTAGRDGIPTALTAVGAVTSTSVRVMVSFHVTGSVGATTVDAVLPSASHPDGQLVVPAQGRVRLTASPVLPADSPRSLADLEVTLVAAGRLGQYQHYLGSPVAGASQATYVFAPAPRAAAARRSTPPERPRPLAIALTLVLLAAAAGAATFAWSRS
jgi:hypothetical protein